MFSQNETPLKPCIIISPPKSCWFCIRKLWLKLFILQLVGKPQYSGSQIYQLCILFALCLKLTLKLCRLPPSKKKIVFAYICKESGNTQDGGNLLSFNMEKYKYCSTIKLRQETTRPPRPFLQSQKQYVYIYIYVYIFFSL